MRGNFRRLLPILLLTVAMLLGSAGVSWSADFQKGVAAFQSGNFATALREWIPLAEQGHAATQSSLGIMYQYGQGVPQDYKTAMKWFRLAAEQAHADAQYYLGLMYERGWGVPQDYKIAAKWWRLAAEQGDAIAQHGLGLMYKKGQGVPQDYKTAMKWFRLAAEQGNAYAQFNVEYLEEMIAETRQQTDESTKPSPFETAKQQCASIGFKEGTVKFGDCVMKLYK